MHMHYSLLYLVVKISLLHLTLLSTIFTADAADADAADAHDAGWHARHGTWEVCTRDRMCSLAIERVLLL